MTDEKRDDEFPEGVGGRRGSQAGQGILRGDVQSEPSPAGAKRQESVPGHLEGGPHEPATPSGRRGHQSDVGEQSAGPAKEED